MQIYLKTFSKNEFILTPETNNLILFSEFATSGRFKYQICRFSLKELIFLGFFLEDETTNEQKLSLLSRDKI